MGDCIKAQIRAEHEVFDEKMQMLAWQTALLMNSTGNFKQKVKPTDLYSPLAEVDRVQHKAEHKPEDKKALQEELLSAFAGSEIVIQ